MKKSTSKSVSKTGPKPLTALEQRIMNAVWDTENATVESVQETLGSAGEDLALPSIRTILSILQEKKYVGRRKEGRKHIYLAKVGREESQSKVLANVIGNSFGGSAVSLLEALIRGGLADKADWEKAKKQTTKAKK